jgi:hypothetical protein
MGSLETGLTSVGIQKKILNGETNNPNNSTIDLIMKYLNSMLSIKT